MKLAESITIKLAGECHSLRPSLRDAISLERRSGSFAAILRGLQEGNLTTYCDLIRPHYTGPEFGFAQRVFDAINELQGPLEEYVVALLGIDPDNKTEAESSGGKATPFKDHLVNLYKVGTGWLGWTPEETLDATPTEIRLAYEGRIDLLKCIFGSNDQPDKQLPDGATLDDKLKSAFGMFKTTKVKSKQKRRKAAA